MISEETGIIETTQSLDREAISSYSFVVVALDQGFPVQSAYTRIRVTVLDDNDNAPEFDQSQYHVTLLERSPIGSVLLLPRAYDPDTSHNANVSYSMSGPEGLDEYIMIDPDTGLIQISSTISKAQFVRRGILMDFQDSSVTVTLRASDRGSPPRVGEALLTLNIDDAAGGDPPVFTSQMYQVTLEENSQQGKPGLTTVKPVFKAS